MKVDFGVQGSGWYWCARFIGCYFTVSLGKVWVDLGPWKAWRVNWRTWGRVAYVAAVAVAGGYVVSRLVVALCAIALGVPIPE